jgi:hypothetical protein
VCRTPMNCIILGCANPAYNNIGVRVRRPSTKAVWAPNTDAGLCAVHSTQGVLVTVFIEETNDHHVETRMCGAAKGAVLATSSITRRMLITKEA